jgi:hypothetical protein
MKSKLIISTITGGITYFILGFLVYGLLFADSFTPNAAIVKEPMVMWAMALSCLIFAFLIALVSQRWAGVKTFSGGFITGIIIGALVSASVDLGMFSMYNLMTLNTILLDIVLNAVMSGITGGVIGLVLGSGTKS